MRITKFYITLICAALTFPAFADTFKEKTDNWLQSETNIKTNNWLGTETWLQPATSGRPGIGQNDTPTVDPYVTPIGDGIPVLFALGLACSMYVFSVRNRKLSNINLKNNL